jgi:membrane-associated phospholipid phosphatase
LACALLPGVVVNLLKLLVVRLLPIAYDVVQEFGWESWVGIGTRFDSTQTLNSYLTQSFPSGHAATAFGFALGLAWLFPRGRGMFLTVALVASLQRVVSAAHWPSYTLAGAAIALVVAGLCVAPGPISRRFERWEQRGTAHSMTAPNKNEQRLAA